MILNIKKIHLLRIKNGEKNDRNTAAVLAAAKAATEERLEIIIAAHPCKSQ